MPSKLILANNFLVSKKALSFLEGLFYDYFIICFKVNLWHETRDRSFVCIDGNDRM